MNEVRETGDLRASDPWQAVRAARACNAHCHVFGPMARFPWRAVGGYAPDADAPREALYALNDRLGFARCVVVQSVCHGFDNAVTADALAGRPGDYRGVALLPLHVSDAELRRLDAAGFRGVRFNFMARLGATPPVADVVAFGARLAPLGWHLQVHAAGDAWEALGPALQRSPVPVVIDHLGRPDLGAGAGESTWRVLLGLLEDPRFWIKTSGLDRISRAGPPYDDALPFARRLLETCGDRVLWGNDWPHTHHPFAPVDDDLLVTLLARLAPDPAVRERLLVDNPQRLYRFDG